MLLYTKKSAKLQADSILEANAREREREIRGRGGEKLQDRSRSEFFSFGYDTAVANVSTGSPLTNEQLSKVSPDEPLLLYSLAIKIVFSVSVPESSFLQYLASSGVPARISIARVNFMLTPVPVISGRAITSELPVR